MYLDALLDELSAAMGIPPLAADAQDRCALRIDEDVQVELHWRQATGMLRLVAPVGHATEQPLRLLATMLVGNLALAERGLPVFAFDPRTGAVVLTQSLDTASLTGTALAGCIERLAGGCRKAREDLGGAHTPHLA
ncbi:MAG: type III secretion system chaperone [Pseudomonadota bacterium]